MEGEKRKRSEKEKNEERSKKNKVIGREVKEKEEEEEVTEEKVDEFFAILRRMQVAVKYFGEGWREAAETAAVVDKATEDDKEEIKEKEESNGLLDLNAEPEGESESHLAD